MNKAQCVIHIATGWHAFRIKRLRPFNVRRSLSPLSVHNYRCLFTVHANKREVINYRLTCVDEDGRERVQLVEEHSRTLTIIRRKSMRFPTHVNKQSRKIRTVPINAIRKIGVPNPFVVLFDNSNFTKFKNVIWDTKNKTDYRWNSHKELSLSSLKTNIPLKRSMLLISRIVSLRKMINNII